MQTEARPRATASIARTENNDGVCIGTSAEIHHQGYLQPEVCNWVVALDEVIHVENGGSAVRITFDRGLSPEEAVDVLKHCVELLGFDLHSPIVQWDIKKRSY